MSFNKIKKLCHLRFKDGKMILLFLMFIIQEIKGFIY
jgi:hypothetical protein